MLMNFDELMLTQVWIQNFDKIQELLWIRASCYIQSGHLLHVVCQKEMKSWIDMWVFAMIFA